MTDLRYYTILTSLRDTYKDTDKEIFYFTVDDTLFKDNYLDTEQSDLKASIVRLGDYTFENHYRRYYPYDNISYVKSILAEEYRETAEEVLTSNYYYIHNIFILKSEYYKGLCDFIGEYVNKTLCSENIMLFLFNVYVRKHILIDRIQIQEVVRPLTDLNALSEQNKNNRRHIPAVTVCVPAYDQQCYIRDCLDSLLKQTFTDFEVLIIDDGSPDNVWEIAKHYVNSDKRFKFIHTINQGVAAARNLGALLSESEYYMNLDADDIISPDYIFLCVQAFEKNQYVYICNPGEAFFKDTLVNLNHKWIENDAPELCVYSDFAVDRLILRTNGYNLHSAMMMKRQDLIDADGYDSSLSGYEDYDLWLRIIDMHPDGIIATTRHKHMFYRLKSNSRNTVANARKWELDKEIAIKNEAIFRKHLPYEAYLAKLDEIIEKKKLEETKHEDK